MSKFSSKLARYNTICCEQVMPVPVIPICAISCALPTPICEVSQDICTPTIQQIPLIKTQYPFPTPLVPPGTNPCYSWPNIDQSVQTNGQPCQPCPPYPSYPPPGYPSGQQKVQIQHYPLPQEPCIGTILTALLTVAPPGYLLCDGSEVSRTTYSDLFAVIGVYFGVGDNSTTFNLPNITDSNNSGLIYIIKF